jgi:hypothetical protein
MERKAYKIEDESVLNKRVIDLTVGELLELIEKDPTIVVDTTPASGKNYAYGIGGIARLFNCGIATANRIKASGVINPAITQWGRKIIVDKELALELVRQSKEFELLKKRIENK